ncbi:hypothetical protein LTR36_005647 [Oleoguttula mirabilis]|uniref:F-box domain-containing protein n=1 Tax=Oleoguttula mirabilis TaxID=1507867 RepID=A0AAV9JDN5_9PEZI|nr:hypothetical protein LTR36_005647 [Oleoguttula mirabilis]
MDPPGADSSGYTRTFNIPHTPPPLSHCERSADDQVFADALDSRADRMHVDSSESELPKSAVLHNITNQPRSSASPMATDAAPEQLRSVHRVHLFKVQVFGLANRMALIEENDVETSGFTSDLDKATRLHQESEVRRDRNARLPRSAKLMTLPTELGDIILDNLPYFRDQLHLAVVSLQCGQNGLAQSVLKRWRHRLFGNPVLRSRLFAGPAFKGEKSAADRGAVGLLSRCMRQGTDSPSARTQRFLGFDSGSSTYQDLVAELEDDAIDTFADKWIVRKDVMKTALKAAREGEEDARYFKPQGKAVALIRKLSALVDGTETWHGMCWGCVELNHSDPDSLSFMPGLDPVCTGCVSIDCDDKLINIVLLKRLGIMTPRSLSVWPKRIVLANGMSYVSEKDADSLSILQYRVPYRAWKVQFNNSVPEDQQKTREDSVRFGHCFRVAIHARLQYTEAHRIAGPSRGTALNLHDLFLHPQLMVQLQTHDGNALVTGHGWVSLAFQYALSHHDKAACSTPIGLVVWIRTYTAYFWHYLLHTRYKRITLARLRSQMQVFRLPILEIMAPTRFPALDNFSCTIVQADKLCTSIHGCDHVGVMKLSAKERRKNLTLHIAETACLLKAIDMYKMHAPSGIQACAGMISMFPNAYTSPQSSHKRLQLFDNLAFLVPIRKVCAHLVLDDVTVFNDPSQVPDDLIVRGAAALWKSPISDEAFRQQLASWICD